MCLHVFCGFLSLYVGCVFIGIFGIILSIVVFSMALFELISGNPHTFFAILAMAFALFHAISMALLLLSTMMDICWALLLSFCLGVISTVIFFGCAVMFYVMTKEELHFAIGLILGIIQMYFLWIILSTWWCCRSTRDNC
ncbi:hypothetical protein KR009_003566 [Drosophila setifemur]|nr:hypothetical protein KR009_003566 [Drosophila setifemur]